LVERARGLIVRPMPPWGWKAARRQLWPGWPAVRPHNNLSAPPVEIWPNTAPSMWMSVRFNAGSDESVQNVKPWLAGLPQPSLPTPIVYVSCDGTGTPMRQSELQGRTTSPPSLLKLRPSIPKPASPIPSSTGAGWCAAAPSRVLFSKHQVRKWVAEGSVVYAVAEACGFGFVLHHRLVEAGAQSLLITRLHGICFPFH